MTNIIELRNINKIYGEKFFTQVLYDVNLDIEENSFNSIIGESGSGKSTLLNIIGTLDKPTCGEVYICGKRTDTLSKEELAVLRNQTIGFIFQFHHLLPEFTVKENVLMPHKIMNYKVPNEVNDYADELLNFVGLSKVVNNKATNLSGGQQQRAAIARALINKPRIILADEPTGNLDSETTDNVYSILRDINKKFNTTFIIITHNEKIAEKTDRIIEVADGKIKQDYKKNKEV